LYHRSPALGTVNCMGWRLHLRCLCSKRACVLHVFWKSSHPVLLLWHWQQSGFPDFLRQTSRVNMGRYGSKFDKNSRKKWTVDVYPQKSENDWDIVCGSLCEKILQFDPDTHLPTWVCRLKIGYWSISLLKLPLLDQPPKMGLQNEQIQYLSPYTWGSRRWFRL
jgi:hypothetical protein